MQHTDEAAISVNLNELNWWLGYWLLLLMLKSADLRPIVCDANFVWLLQVTIAVFGNIQMLFSGRAILSHVTYHIADNAELH
jgi:hypothetical protein